MRYQVYRFRANPVSPLRGEWIEITYYPRADEAGFVSPLRGEWIEINRDSRR